MSGQVALTWSLSVITARVTGVFSVTDFPVPTLHPEIDGDSSQASNHQHQRLCLSGVSWGNYCLPPSKKKKKNHIGLKKNPYTNLIFGAVSAQFWKLLGIVVKIIQSLKCLCCKYNPIQMTQPLHSGMSLPETRDSPSMFREKHFLHSSSLQMGPSAHQTYFLATGYSTWPTYGLCTHGM